MNKSSKTGGFKLTTVLLAVFILGVSAVMSNSAVSSNAEIVSE